MTLEMPRGAPSTFIPNTDADQESMLRAIGVESFEELVADVPERHRYPLLNLRPAAAESLGDVVFVDLPDVGSEVSQLGKFGEIESVKAVSDLFSPVSGTIVDRNDALIDNPEIVNGGPYDGGWLLKVELADASELDGLMSASEYDALTAEA